MLISDWSSDVCSSDPPLCGIANVASVIDREGLDAGTAGKFVEIRRDRHIFEETADRARSVEGSLRAPQHLDPGEVIWQEVDGEAPAFGISRARSYWCLVDVNADARARTERRNATQGDPRLARSSEVVELRSEEPPSELQS